MNDRRVKRVWEFKHSSVSLAPFVYHLRASGKTRFSLKDREPSQEIAPTTPYRAKNSRKRSLAWLKSKAPPVVAQSTHDFYRKSTKKFLEFLGAAALDLSAVTRKMITEFRNQVAQKASATTTNHDLKAIKLIFRLAKRDGYIIEDPSEFVESVRRHGLR